MAQGKTTKWEKKKSGGNVSEFRPKEQPAVTADAREAMVEEIQKEESTATQVMQPTPKDYYPFNEDGTQKEDGLKRIMLMVDPATGTFYPVVWFHANVVEASMMLSEASKILAFEVAKQFASTMASFEDEKDRAVLAALKRVGIIGTNAEEAENE